MLKFFKKLFSKKKDSDSTIIIEEQFSAAYPLYLEREERFKKKFSKRLNEVKPHTSYDSLSSPQKKSDDDLLNPLNPLSPISPFNPIGMALYSSSSDCHSAPSTTDYHNHCHDLDYRSSNDSYSNSSCDTSSSYDSSSSYDTGSSYSSDSGSYSSSGCDF